MNEDQFGFFKALVESTGPSGYEWEAQAVWRERIRDAASQLETDSLGNCIATLNPSGSPCVMLEAHVDQIGFLVTVIDDQGYLLFSPIGSFDGATLPGSRVRILGRRGPVFGVVGCRPSHLLERDRRNTTSELKDMWIDIGVRTREEAEELVAIGNAGGWRHGLQRLHGPFLTSSSMDDRIGGYVVAEAFRRLAASSPAACVLAVSSVQEEVGLRGAVVSSFRADVPIGVAVEVNWTSDHPQAPVTELGDLRVGGGPILGRGANTNPHIYRRLAAAADSLGIRYQIKADPEGTANDENVMQISHSGMATGLIKVPTRYLHTASEVISTDDVGACVSVLCRFVHDLDASILPELEIA